MQLSEQELEFLTRRLRRRHRREWAPWVFVAVSLLMFVAALNMPAPFQLGAVGYTVGQTLGMLAWAVTDLIRQGREARLTSLLLRFINDDAEALQQISAKHGIGDLRS